jgi:hypothetical protein
MKTSVSLLNKDLIPLITKLWDKSVNIVVHNEKTNCNPNFIGLIFKANISVL